MSVNVGGPFPFVEGAGDDVGTVFIRFLLVVEVILKILKHVNNLDRLCQCDFKTVVPPTVWSLLWP